MIENDDRVLIFAPHPDDDILGCGVIIHDCIERKVPVKVVYLTYGDGNELSFIKFNKWDLPVVIPHEVKEMGERRHAEAIAGEENLGLDKSNLLFLGYPDFGTMDIWRKHWGVEQAAKGLFTRANKVPYSDAKRPGAKYKGEEIMRDISEIIENFNPTKVFVSHLYDHHPDHQALHLYVRSALMTLGSSIPLLSYLVHYTHWPDPQGYHPDSPLEPPLPIDPELVWTTSPLTEKGKGQKYNSIKKHETQYKANPTMLESFIRTNELFSSIPMISLTEAKTGFEGVNGEVESEHPISHNIKIEDGNLDQIIRYTKVLEKRATIFLYLFPFQQQVKFSRLPKWCLKITKSHVRLYDQSKLVISDKIVHHHDLKNRSIEVSIPLDFFPNASHLFIQTVNKIEHITVNWTRWKILQLV